MLLFFLPYTYLINIPLYLINNRSKLFFKRKYEYFQVILESVLSDNVDGQVSLNKMLNVKCGIWGSREEIAFTVNILHKLDIKIEITFSALKFL